MFLIAFEFVSFVAVIVVGLLALAGLIFVAQVAWNIFTESLKGFK